MLAQKDQAGECCHQPDEAASYHQQAPQALSPRVYGFEAFGAPLELNLRWIAQICEHRLRVAITQLRPALDRMQYDFLQMRIKIRPEGARRLWIGVGLRPHRAEDVETRERHRSGEHLEQDGAQGVDVAARVAALT